LTDTVVQVKDDDEDDDDDERRAAVNDADDVVNDLQSQQLNGLLNECIILLRSVLLAISIITRT